MQESIQSISEFSVTQWGTPALTTVGSPGSDPQVRPTLLCGSLYCHPSNLANAGQRAMGVLTHVLHGLPLLLQLPLKSGHLRLQVTCF